ncbi:hypothetical protein KP509_10G041800 [Ceratopteris richardii]|uniref:Uncharacterized protein n=1 Tax=Ceratopteris richardii TaxID=49495 RepID=A0A8T2U0F3_CERRI|nr:hypothetical protein KP509_10G041800 [Ceratopteris richardii]
MGIFSFGKKKALPLSEQALAEISDLGRVLLTLDSNRLVYENGHWTADFVEGPISAPDGSLEKEVIELRREKRKLKKELEKYMSQVQEMRDLKEKWNLLDFKYQLLVDMWSMRVLDNERGNLLEREGQLSPGRSSRRNSLALSSQ